MDSDDESNFNDSENEIDDQRHEELIHKVLNLNKGQNLKKPSRTEPTLNVSEFDLVKSLTGLKETVDLNTLTNSLKQRKLHIGIDEKVKKIARVKTLPKPLEKPQAERIRRASAYEKTRLELDRWEATVASNRASDKLSFPLAKETKLEWKEANDVINATRLKSKLEEAIEQNEKDIKVYNVENEKVPDKFALNLKEMIEQKKELAKMRAFLSYKEAKARRDNKIKSKKYHRIQRKAKIKQKLKEFEDLQKTDPEKALQKLEEIEKARVEERFNLRHRSTGKWAKNHQIRAKYDKESRKVLAQQLGISKELTQKLRENKESDVEDELEDEEILDGENPKSDEHNPWLNGVKADEEVTNFFNSYKKYWTEKNQTEKESTENNTIHREKLEKPTEKKKISNNKQTKKKVETVKTKQKNTEKKSAVETSEKQKIKRKATKDENPKKKIRKNSEKIESTTEWKTGKLPTLNEEKIDKIFERLEYKLRAKAKRKAHKLKKKLDKTEDNDDNKSEEQKEIINTDLTVKTAKKKAILDDALIEGPENEATPEDEVQNLKRIAQNISNSSNEKLNIDPEKYMKIQKVVELETAKPQLYEDGEDDEEEDNQREMITEAFEDDDIVDDFHKEKRDEIEKDRPKNIDLSLPGWGAWGGTNIVPNRRKKRRFIIKAPKKIKRRDDCRGNLIINERADAKIREHMVSDVPFPFTSVKDFEMSIRAPIGNTFVPEVAHRKLIRPAVITRMGAIIEPIDKEMLLQKNV